MPILRINAIGSVPELAGTSGTGITLAKALLENAGRRPVLIMVHGYRYSPKHVHLDANNFILQDGDKEGWPHQMGYGTDTADQGICIAFGWDAGGTIWRAAHEAGRAGLALAVLIRHLAHLGAGPVNIIAHSLGARVALACLHHLAPGMINRMVMMTGAELRSTAECALQTPAGQSTQVLNVISRENDVFDCLYEWLLVPLRFGARTLGAGLDLPHCLTAQIDNPHHLAGLRSLGFPTADGTRRMCHWSTYLRPGLFALYGAFLGPDATISFVDLRAALPNTLTRRWSRLLAAPTSQSPFAAQ